jgi:type II secretory pathway component GspD/PulD (secretin)
MMLVLGSITIATGGSTSSESGTSGFLKKDNGPVVNLVVSPAAQNVGNGFPDYAEDVDALHATPSPDTRRSHINDYRFQDEQINVSPTDGDVVVLRTDQKNLLRKFVTEIIPISSANPREIVNGLRVLTGKEGGRAEVLLNGQSSTKHIQVVCPEFQLPYIKSVVAALDKPWVQDFEDGSSAVYYKAKHRDISSIDAVAFDAGTPDQSFRALDTKNNAVYYHDDDGSIGGYMSIVEKVDIPPHQVLVDITAYEITEQDDQKLGLDYIAWKNGPGRSLFDFVISYTSSNQRFKNVSSIFDPFTPGRTTIPDGAVHQIDTSTNQRYGSYNYMVTAAFVDFLSVEGKARIMTSGQLLAKSGTTGVFERVDSLVAFTPTIEFEDVSEQEIDIRKLDYSLSDQQVGFFVKMTPYIGTESLEADIVVDMCSLNGVTPQGMPIVNHRKMASSAVLKDGQPYVLGGLNIDSDVGQKSGMPFLGDIPGLGLLFGGKTDTSRQNRVVIVMKPTVIMDAGTDRVSMRRVAAGDLLTADAER